MLASKSERHPEGSAPGEQRRGTWQGTPAVLPGATGPLHGRTRSIDRRLHEYQVAAASSGSRPSALSARPSEDDAPPVLEDPAPPRPAPPLATNERATTSEGQDSHRELYQEGRKDAEAPSGDPAAGKRSADFSKFADFAREIGGDTAAALSNVRAAASSEAPSAREMWTRGSQTARGPPRTSWEEFAREQLSKRTVAASCPEEERRKERSQEEDLLRAVSEDRKEPLRYQSMFGSTSAASHARSYSEACEPSTAKEVPPVEPAQKEKPKEATKATDWAAFAREIEEAKFKEEMRYSAAVSLPLQQQKPVPSAVNEEKKSATTSEERASQPKIDGLGDSSCGSSKVANVDSIKAHSPLERQEQAVEKKAPETDAAKKDWSGFAHEVEARVEVKSDEMRARPPLHLRSFSVNSFQNRLREYQQAARSEHPATSREKPAQNETSQRKPLEEDREHHSQPQASSESKTAEWVSFASQISSRSEAAIEPSLPSAPPSMPVQKPVDLPEKNEKKEEVMSSSSAGPKITQVSSIRQKLQEYKEAVRASSTSPRKQSSDLPAQKIEDWQTFAREMDTKADVSRAVGQEEVQRAHPPPLHLRSVSVSSFQTRVKEYQYAAQRPATSRVAQTEKPYASEVKKAQTAIQAQTPKAPGAAPVSYDHFPSVEHKTSQKTLENNQTGQLSLKEGIEESVSVAHASSIDPRSAEDSKDDTNKILQSIPQPAGPQQGQEKERTKPNWQSFARAVEARADSYPAAKSTEVQRPHPAIHFRSFSVNSFQSKLREYQQAARAPATSRYEQRSGTDASKVKEELPPSTTEATAGVLASKAAEEASEEKLSSRNENNSAKASSTAAKEGHSGIDWLSFAHEVDKRSDESLRRSLVASVPKPPSLHLHEAQADTAKQNPARFQDFERDTQDLPQIPEHKPDPASDASAAVAAEKKPVADISRWLAFAAELEARAESEPNTARTDIPAATEDNGTPQ